MLRTQVVRKYNGTEPVSGNQFQLNISSNNKIYLKPPFSMSNGGIGIYSAGDEKYFTYCKCLCVNISLYVLHGKSIHFNDFNQCLVFIKQGH